MELKKIIIFDGKMFYNAKHLYQYLDKYYSSVHKVTYYQVQDATGKRLKSIDKFFKVTYEYVSKEMKNKIRRYSNITEGFEDIVCFDVKSIDDFIIKYMAVKQLGFLYVYKNPKKEINLAFKIPALKALIKKYDSNLADIYLDKIVSESILIKGFYHYLLKPSSVKQNIF